MTSEVHLHQHHTLAHQKRMMQRNKGMENDSVNRRYESTRLKLMMTMSLIPETRVFYQTRGSLLYLLYIAI
ncbi:unnamed protein product [Calypogeia fissa]